MSDLALERALLRDRWIVGACLALLVALACLWLWRDHAAMADWEESMAAMGMKDMEMEGGPMATSSAPAAYLVEAFVMWLIMMVAMMLPSAAPMILLYGKLARSGRQQGGVFASTTVFAGFYLVVWGGFSAVAALIQWTLVRSGVISDMGLAFGDRRVAGALLIAAGLYQLTPLKYACLEKCRSPLSFLMRLWRPGLAGAARLGLTHGVYCLGCCAMLMALLFVFGVMNLAWVALLAIVVLIEKVVPGGQRIGRLAGIATLALGVAMVLGLSPVAIVSLRWRPHA
jgi:predicted metal-binding membrane protein